MSDTPYFDEIEKGIKKEHTFFVDFGFDFAKQVKYVFATHPTIKTQKDLALALGKKESEISRMLTGLHNLTLESISKICGVLDYDLILTDLKAQQKYNSYLVAESIVNNQQNYYININITINIYPVMLSGSVVPPNFLNADYMASFYPINIDSQERQMLS